MIDFTKTLTSINKYTTAEHILAHPKQVTTRHNHVRFIILSSLMQNGRALYSTLNNFTSPDVLAISF